MVQVIGVQLFFFTKTGFSTISVESVKMKFAAPMAHFFWQKLDVIRLHFRWWVSAIAEVRFMCIFLRAIGRSKIRQTTTF